MITVTVPRPTKPMEFIGENMEVTESKPDMVNHPSHYTKGGIECLEGIKASMNAEAYKGYLKGNLIKYIWRYEDKGGKEDLQKAMKYLEWLIEAAG